MIPTENEYTLAAHAAAKRVYKSRPKPNPIPALYSDPAWEDLSAIAKRPWLEAVLPIVDAAISAIPDRLDEVRTLADTAMSDAEFRNAVVKLVERDLTV
jgi:hypothetical protein